MKNAECRMQKDETCERPGRISHPAFFHLPSHLLQYVLIILVRLYRITLSPAKTFLMGPAGKCRFEPSCSQYAIEALELHGPLAGSWLAAKRICRCHPWGECGHDPVPAKKFPALKTETKFRTPNSELQVSKSGVRI